MMAAFGTGLFDDFEDGLEDLLVEEVLVEGGPFAPCRDGE